MKIVSVINYKGGVGKTTVTANLAAGLASKNYNILLIDLDPQASLTFSFITPEQWETDFSKAKTIKSWFDTISKGEQFDLKDIIFRPQKVNNQLLKGVIDIIPSHLGLINVDLELATELGGASLKQTKQKYLKIHKRLFKGLKSIKEKSYDVILIDCPPNFNIVTKNAMVASDYILIPAKPDYLSTLGIDYLRRSLNELVKDYNDFTKIDDGEAEDTINPKIIGVLFTMIQEYRYGPISSMRPFIKETKNLDIPVFDSYIKENKTIFADSPKYGVPVALSSYTTPSHQSVVDGIEEFTNEFAKKLGLEV